MSKIRKTRSPAQLANDHRLSMIQKIKSAKALLAAEGVSFNDAPVEQVFEAVEQAGIAPAPSVEEVTEVVEQVVVAAAPPVENPRASRSATTREKTTRRKPWAPPSMLDAPPAPDGFCHRWIRAGMVGEEDKINMSKRYREGYEPVRGDEFPEFDLPTEDMGRHAGVFTIGGLILARIPEETVAERNAYYANKNRSQMAAIDAELAAHSNSTMPLEAPNRKSQVTFGNPENKPEGT